jgi:hypothetical protein
VSLAAAAEAERLFESGKDHDAALLAFAESVWPRTDDEVEPAHAEVARFARVAAYRAKSPTVHEWQTRHVAASSLTGNLRSLCLSLQPAFFVLAGRERFDEAHSVLDAMGILAQGSLVDAPPSAALLARVLTERRAFAFRLEKRWVEAIEWYERALALAPSGSRGEAKVAGGLATARWLGGGSHGDAVEDFSVLVETTAAWHNDVWEAATSNLAAAQAGDRAAAVPFDLL